MYANDRVCLETVILRTRRTGITPLLGMAVYQDRLTRDIQLEKDIEFREQLILWNHSWLRER